ncbi:MAG: iron ABC transporter permease [Clostridia bacterium]|nr:iron ABC transporter permease [Clostridia bacterium]
MLLLDSVYVRNTNLVPLESVQDRTAQIPYAEDGTIRILNNKGKEAAVSLDGIDGAFGYLFAKNGRVYKEGDELKAGNVYVKVQENHLTLDAFPRIFADYTFNRAFYNTLLLGMITGFGSVIIGLLFAYVDCYVNVRSRVTRKMFDVVSMLPVVSPPFVLSLSMILLFGRGGLITRELLGIYDSDVYGLGGIAIVQILTFFPVCYMMLKGLLKNIDPSMEEAARNMGASRMKVFTTVTLPLMLPGLGNAFLVTFIESVADFANPMMIGGDYDTLATTIYLRITGGSYDTNGAAAMAVVLLGITLVLFLIQKYYLEAKTAATLTGKASRARALIDDRSVRLPLVTACSLLSAFVIMMYVAIPFGALFKLWGRDYSLSLKWFNQLFRDDGFKAFTDSFVLSLIASPITALLSMIISYLVVKKRFRAKGFIEFVSMLAMAVPGTVLGVGFIRGFANGIFRTGVMQGIYGTGVILVIVFVVRSLPVGTRSGISALRQIDKSIEESAYDLGAGSAKVFVSVTLPLIKDSFLSGLVTTFVRSITAISAIILLVTPRYLLITCRINEFAEKGAYGVACAYATILIAIVYASIVVMNFCIKHFGTSKQVRIKESE